MSRLDLNLLRIFVVLWDERSVSKAAAKIGISQSAMSHALKRLRTMLDEDLFERSPQGLVPTAFAIGLEPRLRTALQQVERAVAPAEFDPLVSERNLVLAMGPYNCEILLPSIVEALRIQAPLTRITVVRLNAELNAQLEAGTVDVALGSFDGWPPTIDSVSLYREDMAWIAREGHSLGTTFSEDLLRDSRRVAVSTAEVLTYYTERPALQRRTTVQPVDGATVGGPPVRPLRTADVTVYDNRTAIEIVAATDLVAMVPRRVAERYGDRLSVTMLNTGAVPASTSIAMIWSRRHADDAGHRWMRDIICRTAARVDVTAWDEP